MSNNERTQYYIERQKLEWSHYTLRIITHISAKPALNEEHILTFDWNSLAALSSRKQSFNGNVPVMVPTTLVIATNPVSVNLLNDTYNLLQSLWLQFQGGKLTLKEGETDGATFLPPSDRTPWH